MLTETDLILHRLIVRDFDLDEQLFAFAKLHDKLSDEGYWTILGKLYRASQRPWMINSFVGTLFHMSRPGREHLMLPEEKDRLKKVHRNILSIYRGCWSANDTGWNYTTNKLAAKATAKEGPMDGCPLLLEAKVHKNNIEALFLDTVPYETVVVDPRVISVRKITKIPFKKADEHDRIISRIGMGAATLEPEWQRLMFLMPVIQALITLRKAPPEDRDMAEQMLALDFGMREGELTLYGFEDQALKLHNQLKLILEPSEEVMKWVNHFEAHNLGDT